VSSQDFALLLKEGPVRKMQLKACSEVTYLPVGVHPLKAPPTALIRFPPTNHHFFILCVLFIRDVITRLRLTSIPVAHNGALRVAADQVVAHWSCAANDSPSSPRWLKQRLMRHRLEFFKLFQIENDREPLKKGCCTAFVTRFCIVLKNSQTFAYAANWLICRNLHQQ